MKERILQLQPYKPGKSPEQIKNEYNVEEVIKLASNENPFGCSSYVAAAIQSAITDSATYPDGNASIIRGKLATKLHINENQLLFGSGLDEVIQTISRVMLCEGDGVITASETFPQYKHHAIIEGCDVREVPLKNGCFDLEGILNAIDAKTKMIWICNPNNPTGTYVNDDALFSFLEQVPKDILVVLDEAYYEYVTAKDYPETIPLVNNYENLLVLRTFSKIYGLAALRIGYAIGNASLIEKINIARLPFNTSTIAQIAASVALDDQEFIRKCSTQNRQGLQQYEEVLERLHLDYYHSQANFIFIRTNHSQTLFRYFIEKGFIVRPFPNGIRITIGTKQQNEGVLSIIENYVLSQQVEMKN